LILSRIAVFPGQFDPFTKGHEDIALRGAKIFDKLIIAIGHNIRKTRYFPIDFTFEQIKILFKDHSNIEVFIFDELTAAFAKKQGANYVLRGVRNTTDFEYEDSIAQANKNINPELETLFLITSPQFAHISSTIIRELHRYGTKDLSKFVPYELPSF
jgi:pantetheine-phosphate adenylyltransferase